MINIRKFAALDLALHGTRFIVAEFAVGVAVPLILGLLSLRTGLFGPRVIGWEIGLAVWFFGIAANYLPLLIYALVIARAGTARAEGQPEIAHAGRYGWQQVILLVPLLVVVVAVWQELRNRQNPK